MGIPTEFFFPCEDLDDAICPVCLAVLDEPRKLDGCQHHFCDHCIQTWLDQFPEENERHGTCPTCRNHGTPTDPLPEIVSLIATLPARCYYRHFGCEERIPYCHIQNHLRTCPLRPLPCPRFCGAMITARTAAAHMLFCNNTPDFLVGSLMCFDCRYRYMSGDRPTHCNYYLLADRYRQTWL